MLVPTRPPKPLKPMRHEREPRQMNGFLSFLDGALSFVFICFVLGAGLALWLRQSFDAPGPLRQEVVVSVPKGDSALEISERLEKSGVISDSRLFMLQYYVARAFSAAGSPESASLKAGEYQFQPGASVRAVLDTIASGRGVLLKITIPEGLTSRQIVDRLNAEAGLSGEIAEVPAEGTLLADTFKFARGTSRTDILARMQAEQKKLLDALWSGRQEGLPLQSPAEALTLASIVEKETGKAEERPRVAAVFVNRLKKGMRLQSDPTIVYGIVGGQGPLGRSITRADIDGKTPYNTYQIDGLPPGPICNPGRAALAATLNPAATQELYFVADGTGGHTFTSTLKDHNAAVANWRRIERSQKPAGEEGGSAQVPALINATKAAAERQPAPPTPTKKPSRPKTQ
jgi:UPF0755 protein